uniref:TGc domain-containing protein n=1 Tax=Macrostomum lignano TaxID=282301 RepID=A0A1I8HW62_9PLAT
PVKGGCFVHLRAAALVRASCLRVWDSAMSLPPSLADLEYYRAYRPEDGEIDLASYLLDEDNLAEKITSGFYPTPTVLAHLQRTLGEEPKDPDATDVGPFPSRRLKSDIFDAAKFAEKDEFVKSLRPEPLESDAEFAVRLFERSRCGLDSVRAAFCFVCCLPVDELAKAEVESEFYTRVRRMRQTDDSYEIFNWLIGLTDVPSKKIFGYKKGAAFESGMEARRSGGNWTACYVEGEWRLIDPLWGAEILTEFDTGNYSKLDDQGNVEDSRKSEGRLIYGCNEFYFLTDPENLILTHFPVEELRQWQLLDRPLTLAEFHRMPKFFSAALDEMFHYSINPSSHPLNVILGKPGTVKVYLREAAGQMYDYKAVVSIHKSNITDGTRAEIKQQASINGYLSKTTRMSHDTVRFKFVPPCSGKFMLSINLLRAIEYPDKILQIGIEYVSYVIHCPRADRTAKMVPVGCANLMHFGAGAQLASARLKTDEPGEIKVEDGERLIQLESTDQRPHRLECQLYGAADESISPKNLLSWTVGPKTSIQFLSPDSGSFALVVRDRGIPVCQFLLDSASEFRDCRDFPLPDLDSLGGLDVADDAVQELVRPLSHPDPYILCNDPSLQLKFASRARLEIRAELSYICSNGESEELSGYTFISRDSDGFIVDVRFKIAGHYVLQLFYRQSSSSPWQRYMNYFIRCVGQLDGRAEQFPEPLPAWSSDNLLLHPTQKLLPLNKPVSVSVRIGDPDFKVAYLLNEGKNERTVMQRDDVNIWQGTIEGLEDSAGSSVKLLGGPSENMCAELLSYKFESEKDQTIRNKEIRSAAKLNLSRLGNERLRKRKQENHERKEMALDPLPDAPRPEELADLQLENELEKLLLEDEPPLERRNRKHQKHEDEPALGEAQPEAPEDEPALGEAQPEAPEDEPALDAVRFETLEDEPPTMETKNETSESKDEPGAEVSDQPAAGEKAAVADWLNKNLRSDPDCEKYLPIEDILAEIEGKFDDGILLCSAVNAVSQDTIDKRALHRDAGMNRSHQIENITLALNSAQSLGVPVSSEAAELAQSPKLLLDLLWQLIWFGLTDAVKQAAAADSQKLKAMLPETEQDADIRGIAPEQMLMRWVNYHLRNAGSERSIENFSEDVRDSEAYALLLQQICPPDIRDCLNPAAGIVAQSDLLLRAQLVLQNADLIEAREFLQPEDIVSGNSNLNVMFVANLFKRWPCLPELPDGGQAGAEQAAEKPPELVREERTYANWMNSAGVQPRINCLYTDASSGLPYLQLLDQIRPGLVQWSRVSQTLRGARAYFQRLENCDYAVELGRQLGFSLVGIRGKSLLDGDEMPTLALLRQLMLSHNPAAVSRGDSRVENSKRLVDENTIVEWTNEQLQRGGKKSRLRSFLDASLGNCHCLLDLIDCLRPGYVDYSLVLPGATEAQAVDQTGNKASNLDSNNKLEAKELLEFCGS